MTGEKRVGDIMKLSLPAEVDADCSMGDLAAILVRNVKNGDGDSVAVIKNGKAIVGMMEVADLLEHLDPPYVKNRIKMEIFWEGLFSHRWREIAGQKVKGFMRTPVLVNERDNLMKVAYLMNKNKVGTVLVARDGILVGTVSAIDLLNVMLNGGETYTPETLGSMEKNIVNG